MGKDRLLEIAAKVVASEIPKREQEPATWSGARVIVNFPENAEEFRSAEESGMRCVMTKHAEELSWVLFQVRDLLHDAELMDAVSKFEVFGRLANAAQRYLRSEGDARNDLLLLAVIHEAIAMVEEMRNGAFRYLTVASYDEIADDSVSDTERRSGFVSVERTRRFFGSEGVSVPE